jgi:hypothetical protein
MCGALVQCVWCAGQLFIPDHKCGCICKFWLGMYGVLVSCLLWLGVCSALVSCLFLTINVAAYVNPG